MPFFGNASIAEADSHPFCLQDSPVNVRTEPNVSTSQVIGALMTGEEVEMLGKENGWYKISYEGKTAYVYEDYVKEKEN